MKTIFVNGTFDLLHRGHLELLNYAKSLGDYLCVGIDTDDRVKEKNRDMKNFKKSHISFHKLLFDKN